MRIGVFGGTFDPPHLAHLVLAAAARHALDLDRVLFVPAGNPWRKADREVTPAAARLDLVRAAVAPYAWAEVSTIEVDRDGPAVDEVAEHHGGAEVVEQPAAPVVLGVLHERDVPDDRQPAERPHRRTTTSARSRAVVRLVAVMIVHPAAANRSHSAISVSTSKALARSSRTSSSGRCTNARAAATRWAWPPDSRTPRDPIRVLSPWGRPEIGRAHV